MKRSRNPETLLSVIVPYRERQQELLELLNSIPDRDDVEVLLINDHGERLEINPLEFTKVVHVEIPEGRRYAGAGRNVGIDNSSGQFICFADSDDWFNTSELDLALNELHSFKSDVVLFWCRSINDKNGQPGSRHRRYNRLVNRFQSDGIVEHLLRYYPPWGKFIRRAFVVRNALRFEEIRASNDAMFSLQLFCSKPRIAVMERNLYCIRQGHASLTRNFSRDVLDCRRQAIGRLNARLEAAGLGEHRIRYRGFLLNLLRRSPKSFARQVYLLLKERFEHHF